MSAAAVISMRIRRNIRRFREAGALSPDQAISLEQAGVRDFWLFRRMLAYGVYIEQSPGRYWMDEQMAEEYRHERRMRALFITAILAIVFLVFYVFAR
ncbi:hypothetical protein LLG95_08285 [bacterium]|nr:hypothetical protein [bacterium]